MTPRRGCSPTPARRLAAAALGALLSTVPATAGWARWTGTGSGRGAVTTGTLAAPTGLTVTKPAATTVRVAWTASTAPGDGPVTGYHVTRLAGSTPAAACATSPTALTTATTCDDAGLVSGTYTYTVTAVYRTWTATSAASAAVSVADPAPVVAGIVRAGGAAGATSTNGELQWTVTFSKAVTGVNAADFSPVAGSGLGGAPAVTGVTGSGAVYTVTASSGSGSGTLGLDLVDDDSITDSAGNRLGGTGGGNGNFTGATYTLDRMIASVTLVNGSGVAGKIDTGDRIVIRFSRAMDFRTFCGAWFDFGGTLFDFNDLFGGGTKVTVWVEGKGSKEKDDDDTLTVTAGNCLGSPRFGSIDLGSPGYVDKTVEFTSSPMSYDTATRTLTITLGAASGGKTGIVASSAPTYSADPGITDSNGVAVNNSPFGLGPQPWF